MSACIVTRERRVQEGRKIKENKTPLLLVSLGVGAMPSTLVRLMPPTWHGTGPVEDYRVCARRCWRGSGRARAGLAGWGRSRRRRRLSRRVTAAAASAQGPCRPLLPPPPHEGDPLATRTTSTGGPHFFFFFFSRGFRPSGSAGHRPLAMFRRRRPSSVRATEGRRKEALCCGPGTVVTFPL